VLYFRVSVPSRHRDTLKTSELTQSLQTESIKKAIPAVYRLASQAKQLFYYLDIAMNKNNTEESDFELDFETLLELARDLENDENKLVLKNKAAKELLLKKRKDYFARVRGKIAQDLHTEELEQQRKDDKIKHSDELRQQALQIKADAFDKLQAASIAPAVELTATTTKKAISTHSKAPMLSVAFDEFVTSYKGKGSKNGADNLTKIKAFGKLFIGHLIDKKIDLLTQKEVNDFFKLLVKYPGGRGGKPRNFNTMSLSERVKYGEENDLPRMGKATFEANYKSPATQFCSWLMHNYEEWGLTFQAEHLDYNKLGGHRDMGEDRQRALTIKEVEKLMCSSTKKMYVDKDKTEHQYWLPMIALHTGARVNEICQLNPQHDIVKDADTNIWYFNFTDENAGADISKSLKNKSSVRKIPIHSILLACGFGEYLNQVKQAGHDRLFNNWKPKSCKASYHAEAFFRVYLAKVGLQDTTTLKNKVVGMHCLRSTFISHAVKQLKDGGLDINQALVKIQPIVGHSENALDENGKDLKVTAGYVDKSIV
jgi:integrase